MTEQQHPITPPPERFKQWEDDILNERDNVDHVLDCAWRDGFRAGADQELEACCKALEDIWDDDDVVTQGDFLQALRTARRPKPLSLAEQAQRILVENGGINTTVDGCIELDPDDIITIRAALERLKELEAVSND